MPSSIHFSLALVRPPTPSVVDGLRADDGPDPDFAAFLDEALPLYERLLEFAL